jgi:Holliday junction resolvase
VAKKINSREKGKAGEREFAALCRKHGFENARRGQQYNGLDGQDVVGLDGIHIEVKRVERLNIEQALQQAERDKKENEIPIVAHRRNRESWKITMRAEDWFKLYRAWREKDE